MTYKKRPKNKQELSAKSGKRVRKELPKKDVVEFEFIHDGVKFGNMKNGEARLKIMSDGGISCLINIDQKWVPVRAKLTKLKFKTIVVRKEKEKKKW